ncbi:MAG: CheA signal transduction histidine kinase [Verrucomicrobia bacterium]|nr:CheA signal transduction histidine kinase [Verrucomicrobiota bacterium]
MGAKDEEFLKSLRATFQVEAAEHLQTIATALLALEKNAVAGERDKLIADVFRAAHSLKGAARATDFTEIESLCQSLEDTFAIWKREKSAPTLAALDKVHRALNTIAAVLSRPEVSPGQPSFPNLSAFDSPSLFPRETGTKAAGKVIPSPTPEITTLSPDETVRITVSKLDARLVEAEEMLTAKLTTGQRAAELRELGQSFEIWRNEWARIEPEARLLRQAHAATASGRTAPANPGLVRLLDFLDWFRDQTKALENKVSVLTRTAEQDSHVIGRLVDDLLKDSKKLLLLPFASLAAPFPKLVRDLCRDQGKEADLVVRGETVEIDKRVLEEMKDPLVHLLRNSIDHGIEPPDQRVRAGKPARATITLAASPVNGSKVELVVSDDGAGIDLEKVRESAVKLGRLSADEARHLDEAAARELIFQDEVSTSPHVTRLSGRGLGLAIVREKAEKLGGTVSVESQPGQGTRFRILLPSMLATFRGVLIEAAGRRFVVPTFQVERVARVKAEEVRTVEGRETIALDGRTLAYARLADVLDLPAEEAGNQSFSSGPILVLGLGDHRIAFAVDAVLDEQEVLVKPLRKPLSRVRNIAGATVLASGEVAPVLNVADLLKSARKVGATAPRTAPAAPAAQVRTILVAEDSITSRMLLKSVLESAGYRVRTAVDGMDAFMLLRTEKFDLVVSDVEMPRLNGLDLTARIRADRRLAELPVVLVTALDAREDRERGIEVGANAYIVKGRFDQSDLLDAIRRLV